jgi:hypothetical protein
MVRLEGNMSLKIPVISPGIDPGTVRLVAPRLNHYATPGPLGIRKIQATYKHTGGRKPQAPRCRDYYYILCDVAWNLLVLNVVLGPCRYFGVQNFEMAPRFLENVCIPTRVC